MNQENQSIFLTKEQQHTEQIKFHRIRAGESPEVYLNTKETILKNLSKIDKSTDPQEIEEFRKQFRNELFEIGKIINWDRWGSRELTLDGLKDHAANSKIIELFKTNKDYLGYFISHVLGTVLKFDNEEKQIARNSVEKLGGIDKLMEHGNPKKTVELKNFVAYDKDIDYLQTL